MIKTTAFFLLLLLAACQPRPAGVRPLADAEGEIVVYLPPLPQGADRLRLALADVAAVRDDGTFFPLQLQLTQIAGGERQTRLLATGRLPAGEYQGLAVTVAGASVQTEDGEASLLLPEGASMVESRFSLPRRGALLFELSYRHDGAIRRQFEFIPAFSLHQPERPVASRLAFAGQAQNRYLSVLDRKELRVTGILPTEGAPAAVAIDARSRRAYVALPDEDAIAAFDLASGAAIGRLALPGGDRPTDLVLSRDGRLLLVAAAGADAVSFVDTAALGETFRLPVGDEPRALLLDDAGRIAYAFNYRSHTVSVLHLDRREIAATLATEPGPQCGALSRDGSRLYVAHADSPYLLVVDTVSLAVRERLTVGRGASDLLVDRGTDLLYLGMADEARVQVIDPFSFLAVDYLPLPGAGVRAMAIDDEENTLLVALAGAARVVAIDLVGKRQTATVETGGEVQVLGITGERR